MLNIILTYLGRVKWPDLNFKSITPAILECEVKWALGNITINKASGGDETPAEFFQILKNDAVKVLYSICQKIWKTQQRPQNWKRSVFIPIPKKTMPKNVQTNIQFCLFHMLLSRVMLKFLQARLQQYVNWELPEVQARFGKGEGTRDLIASIHWLTEKRKEFHKKNLLLLHWLR